MCARQNSSIFISIFLILGLLGCKQDTSLRIPEFKIILEGSKSLNTADIPAGYPIVMVHYSGECGECHDEVRDIMSRMDELKDVKFYFVTNEPINQVTRFKEYLGLGPHHNIIVGVDTGMYLRRFLNANTTPIMALFDRRKTLRGIMKGKVPVDTLIIKIREL